jgi:hypothetical protein
VILVHNVIPILEEEDAPQRHHLGVDIPNTRCTTAVFGKFTCFAAADTVATLPKKPEDYRR